MRIAVHWVWIDSIVEWVELAHPAIKAGLCRGALGSGMVVEWSGLGIEVAAPPRLAFQTGRRCAAAWVGYGRGGIELLDGALSLVGDVFLDQGTVAVGVTQQLGFKKVDLCGQGVEACG